MMLWSNSRAPSCSYCPLGHHGTHKVPLLWLNGTTLRKLRQAEIKVDEIHIAIDQ
jgi:hypothetical protein